MILFATSVYDNDKTSFDCVVSDLIFVFRCDCVVSDQTSVFRI